MYGKRTEKRLACRKACFLAGTMHLRKALNRGGAKEISHGELLEKVRGMVKTWRRFAKRNGIEFKLYLVLSDWSESKQKRSDLHVHFLLYSSAASLGRNFFAEWWMRNGLGFLKTGEIRISSTWQVRLQGEEMPVNAGWLDYLKGNYTHSSHRNRWQLESDGLSESSWTSWAMLNLPSTVEPERFTATIAKED